MLLSVRHAVALLALAASGCGGCSGGASRTDAGVDAGDAGDAGRDGGRDAGRDSGRDASSDAGGDTMGDSGVDPGWTLLPGNADGCTLEYARDASAVYTPQWTSCPAGSPVGCERLDMPSGAFGLTFVGPEGFRFFVVLGDAETRFDVVSTHDHALQALRGPAGLPCTGAMVGGGAGRIVFVTHTFLPDRMDERDYPVGETDTVWGPPLRTVSRLGDNVAQEILVSASAHAAAVQPAGILELYEGGRTTSLRGRSGEELGPAFLIGGDVFWEGWGAGYVVRVYHGDVATGATLFYETPDGSDLKGFATDGIDMAWTQGYGPRPGSFRFDRYELWTAPFTADTAALAPRRVAAVTNEGINVVGDGWYMIGTAGPVIELVRLSDGTRKVLPALGDGFAINAAPVIREGIVAARAERRLPTRIESTVFLIPIASLPDAP